MCSFDTLIMNAVLGLLKVLEVNQMAATVKGRLLVLVLGLEAIKSNVMGKRTIE